MPRKTSQRSAAIAEAKSEGSAPRRSGRAVTKQETSAKEASRSRRSSTAAQTAASVADSKAPKGKGSSRRESSSPSDARGRTGSETPATRVKSTRRSTGRVNYKESDGEEEVPTPKYDENFESGDELEDSDSDDKSKSRSKGRAAKAKVQTKSKGASRSRRGRPSKKKEEEEENETFDVSDDSVEPEEVPVKRGRTVKEKETAKPARSRRQRSEVTESKPVEEKSRPTRRSGRTSSNKEESPKKRPSRGLQAKRYAEEEDDDIEEISDSKADEDEPEEKESDGRKRKRDASPEEANKRLKEDVKEDAVEDVKEVVEDQKDEPVKDKEKNDTDEKAVEEPMEIDESDSANVSQISTKTEDVKEESIVLEKKDVSHDTKKDVIDEKMEQGENSFTSKEKPANSDKQVDIESSKKDENKQLSDCDTGNRLDTAASESDNLQDTKENVENDHKTVEEISENQSKVEATPQPTESSVPAEEKSEKSKNLPPIQPSLTPESATEKITDKNESSLDIPAKVDEISRNDGCVSEVKQSVTEVNLPVTPVPVSITLPKEPVDAAFNGAEKSNTVQNSTNATHSTSTVNVNVEHIGNSTLKANGAHNDVQHTNSSPKDQYYLPGRKYISNAKLNESLKQSIKNHMFGFVSFNLGTPDSDAYLQKEKLLNELGKLDAHVICLQQVAKPFYNAVLEPSLDALGFKSVFSQPEDSLKGMATFYKSSLFRLSGKSDVSLKELIEMEIETSSLNTTDKVAVRTHIRRCGSVLFTHFSTVIGTQTITIANVQIPRSDFSSHALQISCLAQEVVRVNGGTNKPLLLGGEFNIAENDASYQLLRDGYLSNEMIEELQQRKDVALPGRENDSLLNLLWKSFQHPSSNLCSCYHSVLGHEFVIPELKTASPDLLWYSSDSLHTVGVLDVVSDKVGDHHLSLKADIAFSV
ncbi:uncharacterized protein TNIN_112771 [Trichonephila inaurata madagascariensis]|uniref:Endonuclease/exonuclease/phosphatase domain-containing protein n=1 Tax=Trichonephila inaurata madagascariensis TaxID=2747483 RepID=A0A8X6Y1S5_9ARAC|nr:uncharacterized protein TNIN_112771 [Trichonephila inaurata madagascariensis]